MALMSFCPRCGEFFGAEDATCRYCGYVGVIPLEEEDKEQYVQIMFSDSSPKGHQKYYNYLDELREGKYQLRNHPAYDETLWNEREQKDKLEVDQKIKKSKKARKDLRKIKVSREDRDRAFGITCPACGSNEHVYRISVAKKMFAAGLMGAMSAGLQAKTFQCKNCGYKW